jgi:hypothetical protein
MPTPGEKKEENICTIHTSSYITEIVIVSVPPGCNEVRYCTGTGKYQYPYYLD